MIWTFKDLRDNVYSQPENLTWWLYRDIFIITALSEFNVVFSLADREREKPRNQEQTIKLDRNWALLVHGIFVPNDDDQPFQTPVWSDSFHVCCSWKVVVAAKF